MLANALFGAIGRQHACLLYTSDAADERSSVDLGGRRIIKKKNSVHRKESSDTYKATKMTLRYAMQAEATTPQETMKYLP